MGLGMAHPMGEFTITITIRIKSKQQEGPMVLWVL